MSAPDFPTVFELSKLLRDLNARFAHDYRWLHPAANEPRRGGNKRASAICGQCNRTGYTDEGRTTPCEACAAVAPDQTGELVATRAGQRAKLEEAARLQARAIAAMQGALNLMGELTNLIDKGADRTVTDPNIAKQFQKKLTRDKVAFDSGTAAQRRRMARGEGYGAA